MSEAPAVLEFWPTIFHSFRAEDHKFLVVSTSNGLEVAVQEILRVEEGLVMIRGRIAGTADSGRLFLLPFAQLSSVYVNRPVRMEEVDLFSCRAGAKAGSGQTGRRSRTASTGRRPLSGGCQKRGRRSG
jgi:hypothetical protein